MRRDRPCGRRLSGRGSLRAGRAGLDHVCGQLRFPGGLALDQRGVHQHQHGRALSRRRAAGGLLHRRAAGRPGGGRARHRSGRAQAAQLHRARRHAVPERDHDGLRFGRVRKNRRHGGGARRPRRVRGPQGRLGSGGQASRPRHHLFHRDRRAVQRPHAALFRPGRRGHDRRRHPQPRPGPPDRLCADGFRMARRAVRQYSPDPGRYRPGRLWARHLRFALGHRRRGGAEGRRGPGDRQGEPHGRPSDGGGGGRYRVRRRQLHRRRHRQVDRDRSGRARLLHARGLARGVRHRARSDRQFHPHQRQLPQRVPYLRGRGGSRDRRGRPPELRGGQRFGADHQPAAVRGAGPWRARPGHRPGAVRTCRL